MIVIKDGNVLYLCENDHYCLGYIPRCEVIDEYHDSEINEAAIEVICVLVFIQSHDMRLQHFGHNADCEKQVKVNQEVPSKAWRRKLGQQSMSSHVRHGASFD